MANTHMPPSTPSSTASTASPPSGPDEAGEQEEAIFRYWVDVMNKSSRAKFDARRRAAVRRALRDYSLQECFKMIDGCAKSDFHMGGTKESQVGYNDLNLILRDAEHMERFLELGETQTLTESLVLFYRGLLKKFPDDPERVRAEAERKHPGIWRHVIGED